MSGIERNESHFSFLYQIHLLLIELDRLEVITSVHEQIIFCLNDTSCCHQKEKTYTDDTPSTCAI